MEFRSIVFHTFNLVYYHRITPGSVRGHARQESSSPLGCDRTVSARCVRGRERRFVVGGSAVKLGLIPPILGADLLVDVSLLS